MFFFFFLLGEKLVHPHRQSRTLSHCEGTVEEIWRFAMLTSKIYKVILHVLYSSIWLCIVLSVHFHTCELHRVVSDHIWSFITTVWFKALYLYTSEVCVNVDVYSAAPVSGKNRCNSPYFVGLECVFPSVLTHSTNSPIKHVILMIYLALSTNIFSGQSLLPVPTCHSASATLLNAVEKIWMCNSMAEVICPLIANINHFASKCSKTLSSWSRLMWYLKSNLFLLVFLLKWSTLNLFWLFFFL